MASEYETLGVLPDAPRTTVNLAFRRLSRLYDPALVGKTLGTRDHWLRISAAYDQIMASQDIVFGTPRVSAIPSREIPPARQEIGTTQELTNKMWRKAVNGTIRMGFADNIQQLAPQELPGIHLFDAMKISQGSLHVRLRSNVKAGLNIIVFPRPVFTSDFRAVAAIDSETFDFSKLRPAARFDSLTIGRYRTQAGREIPVRVMFGKGERDNSEHLHKVLSKLASAKGA